MKSMTGFGKGEAARDGRRVRVELKSVNHRYLDVAMRMPPFLMTYEIPIRQQLSTRLSRGRVEVIVAYEAGSGAGGARLNLKLAAAYAQAAAEAASSLGIPDDFATSALLSRPDVLVVEPAAEDAELVGELIRDALDAALSGLIAARVQEGSKLLCDILGRLDLLGAFADRIEARKDMVTEEYRRRLAGRVEVLLHGTAPDAERMAQEVAFFADRCDVTEEIVRIRSHLEQFRSRCREEGPVGKPLDFIVQELNREFNTIGSKSQDTEITAAVIDGKAEIEKIREQIQNVE